MKRTGSVFLGTILWLLLLAGFTEQAAAQDVDVQATVSETKIFSGERLTLSIEISGNFNNVSRPSLPGFDGLRLLSNTPSTSRSFSYVNGETSTTYSYQYSLIAQNEGDYQIPPISIEIDGTEYRTSPISVSVIDRNSSANNPTASTRPDIFLRLEVSDDSPVTGQQLITDVVLYFKSGLEVNSYQPVPGWKAEGFWKEELENGQRPRAESVILNGVRYRRARLLQFSLFPTKSGELTISPYEIVVSVRSASSRSDRLGSIFGGFGSNQRRVELESEPVDINVVPLPDISDANYIGAVGYYDISRTISSRETIVGETIEIETRVNGTGNVPLISKPEYELPDGLEVYDPQETTSLNRRNQQISGTKTFTDVVIARRPGNFNLPSTTIAYFNPQTNRYVTETLPEITFSVSKDPNATVASSQQQTFDIKPVTGLASWTTPENGSSSLVNLWWFWSGLALPAILLFVAYRWKQFRDKMDSDEHFARSYQAYDKATQHLEEVITQSENGDIKGAYNSLHKVLTGYIGDKLGLPQAGLSDREYIAKLEETDLNPELVKNVRMLLDKCSSISYAPETSHEYLKSHVGLAEQTLNKLKKEL
ncbi:BatD family protein [Aliifodinibius sp. S!AR15-10]|uniref:BatD family protein n=1 Tax=Aliifodinibius sp. S!AR15-10 TaxID=2950437 RepID=UPI0028664E48|nr:BatD family protein [Aliifodinibius sp. S!AR15-10]MDR8392019.1 BatD family protein [Aliifodinibius sp. S!AR15-10]